MSKAIKSYWEAIDTYYNDVVNIYGSAEEFLSSTAQSPRSVVLLHAAHMCQSEVHNGGFLQLFWNGSGILVPESIEGFQAIGMDIAAAIVSEAALLLGTPYPRDREERWNALLAAGCRGPRVLKRIFKETEDFYLAYEKATETLPFEKLNGQFWKCMKSENGGFKKAATRYAQAVELQAVDVH